MIKWTIAGVVAFCLLDFSVALTICSLHDDCRMPFKRCAPVQVRTGVCIEEK